MAHSSMWVITNKDAIRDRWSVAEFEMSSDSYCARRINANPIASDSSDSQHNVRNALDGSSVTRWEAWCDTCGPDSSWLGMDTRVMVDVLCVRIFQHANIHKSATTLALLKWNGQTFEESMRLDGVGGGYFHRRPAGLGTLWRVKRPIPDDEVAGERMARDLSDYSDISLYRRNDTNDHPLVFFSDDEFDDRYLSENATDPNAADNLLDSLDDTERDSILSATDMPDVWEIKEVRFYTDAACSQELQCTAVIGPHGVMPMISDYDVASTKKTIGDQAIEAAEAICDQDSATAVSMRATGWIGIDLRARPEIVRCVEIEQQTGRLHTILELEVWSGSAWVTPSAAKIFGAPRMLEGLGVGKMKRPALPGSTWRLSNVYSVDKWTVHELEFFVSCSSRVGCGSMTSAFTGHAIASGSYTEENAGENIRIFEEQRAFDKDLSTSWLAQCVRCKSKEAWIGLQMGEANHVGCVRINQSGFSVRRSSSVYLEMWDGRQWVEKAIYHDLGGDSWHYRPRSPNTMWRVVYESRNLELIFSSGECQRKDRCPSDHKKPLKHMRTWGVAELQLFHDDECTAPLVGRPIVSGSLRGLHGAHIPEHAVDGVTQPFGTAWAPSCNVEDRDFGRWGSLSSTRIGVWHYNATLDKRLKLDIKNATDCVKANREIEQNDICAGEWIGIDFHPEPKEVRCVKIVQSRNDHTQCCDPADKLRLERWNGTHWSTAWWLHNSGDTTFAPVKVSAAFSGLGACAHPGQEAVLDEYVEKRSRKLSPTCKIPLPASVKMMAGPQCSLHPHCKEIFTNTGACCPVKDEHNNRCCCSFLYEQPDLFEGGEPNDRIVVIESGLILWTNVFPFVFLFAALVHWYLVTFDVNPSWIKLLKFKTIACEGLQGTSLSRLYLRWALVERHEKGKNFEYWIRLSIHFVLCSFLGGASLSILLGFSFGFGSMFSLVALTMIVRQARSRFDMRNLRHQKIRTELVMQKIRDPDDLESPARFVGMLFTGLFFGLSNFGKFVVDFALVFTVFVNAGFLSPKEVTRVLSLDDVYNVKVLPKFLEPLANVIYLTSDTITFASSLMGEIMESTTGVPRCEGPTLLISSVIVISMGMLLPRWILYDFGGIFSAALECVQSTRPPCQAAFIAGAIFIVRGVIFIVMQSFMLLFVRALQMADPSEALWMCAFNDISAVLIGRILISVTAFVGVAFFVLAADGRFTGSTYVMARMARAIGIDLTPRDPEDDAEDVLPKIRLSNWGCIIPTTFGLWFDNWNVKAYMIKERAHHYATEFGDPQPCLVCEETHVCYSKIIKATSRQVSLAWQVVPVVGILLGKTCEYLNDPATYYNGNELGCFKDGVWELLFSSKKNRRQGVDKLYEDQLSKAHYAKYPKKIRRLIYVSKKAQTFNHYVLPFLQRMCSMCLAVLVMVGPALVRPDTVNQVASSIFVIGFSVSMAKGLLDYGATSLVLTIMGMAILAIKPPTSEKEASKPRGINLTQTVLGTMTGTFVAVSLGASGSVLQSWALALIAPVFVSASAVIVAWYALRIKKQLLQLALKLLFIAFCVFGLAVASSAGEIRAEKTPVILVVFTFTAMLLLMLLLSSKTDFPFHELERDPRCSLFEHFKTFAHDIFLTRKVLAPYLGVFMGLALALVLDQYGACTDSLKQAEDFTNIVLPEGQSKDDLPPHYTGPYCEGPSDWSKHSRIFLHWLTAPFFAILVTVGIDGLLENVPVLCATCFGLLANFGALCGFMHVDSSFRNYVFVFVFIFFVSLSAGAWFEKQKEIELWRTFPYEEEEEEVVIPPRLRPWEDENFEIMQTTEERFQKMLLAQHSIQDARDWRIEEAMRDPHASAKNKLYTTTFSDAVRHTTANLQKQILQLTKEAPPKTQALEGPGDLLAIEDEGSTNMAAVEAQDLDLRQISLPGAAQMGDKTEETLNAARGLPAHSTEVVQETEWHENPWHRPPSQWLDGIPPPQHQGGSYRPVR